MEYLLFALVVVLVVVAIVGAAWRSNAQRTSRREAERRRAMAEFEAGRTALARAFLHAAAATGKPRGLRWKSVDLSGAPTFALDASCALYALIAATISFEAVEGGGMEDVEAVGNLRSATAVFVHRGGAWTTEGRVIFNLEPGEAMQRFDATLQPVK